MLMRYNNNMQTETSFDKFNSFVKDQILFSNAPYIQQMPYGFKVNGYVLKKQNGYWLLFDKNHQQKGTFSSKRIALLATVMLIKNMTIEYIQLKNIDKSLDILQSDHLHYTYLNKKNPDNDLYQSRLDKVDQNIDFLKTQLSLLEKSVNLQ